MDTNRRPSSRPGVGQAMSTLDFYRELFAKNDRPAVPEPPRPARPFNPANPEEISAEEFYRQVFARDRQARAERLAAAGTGAASLEAASSGVNGAQSASGGQSDVNAEIVRIFGRSPGDSDDPLQQFFPPNPVDALGPMPHQLGPYRHQEQPVIVPGDPLLYSQRGTAVLQQAPIDATTENKGIGGSIVTGSGAKGSTIIEVYGTEEGQPTSWGMTIWDKTGKKDGPTGWDLYGWKPLPEAAAKDHPLYREVNDRFFYRPRTRPKGGKK